MICILNGPVIFQAAATLSAITFKRSNNIGDNPCGGKTKVASPE